LRRINQKTRSARFETNFKKAESPRSGQEEVLSMLSVYSTEAIRKRFTLIYRGYDLEVTRAKSGWLVGVYPRSADLPILRRSDFYSCDHDEAVIQAKDRVDRALLF
jgi:hypothetical protein